MRKLISLLAVTIAVMAIMLAAFGGLASAASRTVQVPCGSDIDAKINADPSTTSTRFVLGNCTYTASATIKPKNGDEVAGPTGTFTQRGPAFDPSTTATIVGTSSLTQVMKPQDTVRLEWITVEGGNFDSSAGSGVGIAGGAMSPNSTTYAVTVRNNEGAGISNMNGTFDSIELTNNTTNSSALGFIGSGGKAISEVHVFNSYVHDTQGNGLWCDVFCTDTSLGQFVARNNLVVNNGRAGIRWERIGTDSASGEALIEQNEVHGNGYDTTRGGIDVRDAANALIQNNHLGGNVGSIGIRATDSGRTDRPNLYNIDILNNQLNGDIIKGCELPDSIVFCSGNN